MRRAGIEIRDTAVDFLHPCFLDALLHAGIKAVNQARRKLGAISLLEGIAKDLIT